MAWTDPRTWNIGELVTKAIMDAHVRDQFRVLQSGAARQILRMNAGATAPEYGGFIGARVKTTSDQTIPDSTPTAVVWHSEVFDTDGFWAAGSPTIFTLPYTGYYLITATILWESAGGATTAIGYARLNSSSAGELSTASGVRLSALSKDLVPTAIHYGAAGETISVLAFLGGPSDIDDTSFFSITFLGP